MPSIRSRGLKQKKKKTMQSSTRVNQLGNYFSKQNSPRRFAASHLGLFCLHIWVKSILVIHLLLNSQTCSSYLFSKVPKVLYRTRVPEVVGMASIVYVCIVKYVQNCPTIRGIQDTDWFVSFFDTSQEEIDGIKHNISGNSTGDKKTT